MKTTSALAAKAIKAELKKAFPAIKFSVKSDNFAGGDAVRISYEDGVPEEEVTKIADKYQYGHFDDMTDCYEYSNQNDSIPQAKYVNVQRSISEIARTLAKISIAHDYGIENIDDEQEWRTKTGNWSTTTIYQKTRTLNLA